MKKIAQNYNNCLVNLSNSILKYYGIQTYHNTLYQLDKYLENNYKNVIIILYDGLGNNLIEKGSFLDQNKIVDITSVFPATTTAATTSIITGLTPAEHCWLGWNNYIKSVNEIVTMYWNVIKDTDIQVANYNVSKNEFPYTTILELINNTKKAKAYCISPFDGIYYNQNNIDEMYEKIIELCSLSEKKFIYAYCNEPDNLMHQLSPKDNEVIKLIKNLDDKTEKLCKKLEDTLIIITADHGHITIKGYIVLEDYPVLKNMLFRKTSIEPRATNFFVKKEMVDKFKEEFNKLFSDDFILFSKQEVIEQKLFGDGNPHKSFESCLGDYLAVAISDKAIVDDYSSTSFKGMHAGITDFEILVPLIVVDKK
ncbi:MAG: alkaline phosphatase family protein [Bacilli bacterium]|nr:alkaline phosphatase family protein [Bacilli bacterium]